MSFGGIKIYHLIHLNFAKNQCEIFEYQKDRRLTARQAWIFMRENKPVKIEELSLHANIDDYVRIVNKFAYEIKYCDRYMTFRC